MGILALLKGLICKSKSPKVSNISTTSKYSDRESLSSICDIQVSIFFLNSLKQNQKWNSKIEPLGSCPKVSHKSTPSNYSGSQSLSSIWDVQFSITNNMLQQFITECFFNLGLRTIRFQIGNLFWGSINIQEKLENVHTCPLEGEWVKIG